MEPSASDNFMDVALAGSQTTLASPGKAIGASSLDLSSAAGWPTDTGVIFALRRVDTSGKPLAGTYTEWAGALSGTTLSGLALEYGTDQVYAADGFTQVYIPLSYTLWHRMITTILQQHKQDGTHKSLTTDTLQTSGNATVGGNLTVDGVLDPSGGMTPGTVNFAALLSTIFGDQVQSQANSGTAGGTMHWINLGGIKLLWGVTGVLTNSGSGFQSALYGITFPTFFTSISSFLHAVGNLGNTQFQHSAMNTLTTANSGIYLVQESGANGSAVISYLVIGI